MDAQGMGVQGGLLDWNLSGFRHVGPLVFSPGMGFAVGLRWHAVFSGPVVDLEPSFGRMEVKIGAVFKVPSEELPTGRDGIRLLPDGSLDFRLGEGRFLLQESEEDILRIFERFYKGDKSRTGQGSGMGLAIVKHIIEAHGGTISVTSSEGQGSTFTLHFPHTRNSV